ncbi:hypothetical protein [Halococcus salsus]|jgi:MFS family permease|uniref:hypothetical protein n=1 Tax=Halococcus salsus TaxID=2162894 RepID=UPI00135A50C9|nr:hypothetical protein [Halococcus salsus]
MAVLMPIFGSVNGWTLFTVAGLFGLVVFVFPPLLQSLVAEYSPETNPGVGYGLTSAGNFAFGGFVGTLFAGWLVTTSDYPTMFTGLAVFPLAGVAIITAFLVWK